MLEFPLLQAYAARSLRTVCAVVATFVFAACAGGGSGPIGNSRAATPNLAPGTALAVSATAAPSVPSTQSPPVQVELAYQLPQAATTSAQNLLYRRLKYISAATTTINIAVTPLGGGTSNFSGPCTSTTCNVNFTTTPGANTIAFTLTDGVNVLSSFQTIAIVQPSTINTLRFTANPVVASAALQLASATVAAGAPGSVVVTLNAKDAANNTIVGSGNYVDSTGQPLTFSLNVSNQQAGGKGSVALQGLGRITAPGQPATTARYDGQWLQSSTISATSNSSVIGSVTGATLTTVPTIYEYGYVTNTGGHTMTDGGPLGITPSTDGNLWVAEYGNGGVCILKVATTGTMNETCPAVTANAAFHYLVVGPDGNLWISESNNGSVAQLTPGGVIREFGGFSGSPLRLVNGPDGNLWSVGGTGGVARISPSGSIQNFTTPFGELRGIGVGADGNLWFVPRGSAVISRLTRLGKETDFSYTASCSGSVNESVVSGPDGNLWFPECDGAVIGRASLSGVVTGFSSGITAGAAIRNITVGPDKNLWFTEQSGNRIGRITTSGVVTEFTNGMTGSAAPIDIVTGPDGNLWFTEYGTNKIAKFVL